MAPGENEFDTPAIHIVLHLSSFLLSVYPDDHSIAVHVDHSHSFYRLFGSVRTWHDVFSYHVFHHPLRCFRAAKTLQ